VTAILVTRPAGNADPMAGALETAGYRVHAVPTVAIDRLHFTRPKLADYDWIVVTSASGVDALGDLPAGPRWAAVGPATARALRARGIAPALVPEETNGLALANAMPDAGGKHVLLVRAAAAAPDLPERLRERGAEVDELAAYATVEGPASSAEPLTEALADADLSAVVFASGSAVRGFIALGGTTALPAITIGPRTTAVARELGFRVIAEATAQSAEALAAAVVGAIPLEETNRA
jgi:uroporphyrinogen III methyltransferase/synthase